MLEMEIPLRVVAVKWPLFRSSANLVLVPALRRVSMGLNRDIWKAQVIFMAFDKYAAILLLTN